MLVILDCYSRFGPKVVHFVMNTRAQAKPRTSTCATMHKPLAYSVASPRACALAMWGLGPGLTWPEFGLFVAGSDFEQVPTQKSQIVRRRRARSECQLPPPPFFLLTRPCARRITLRAVARPRVGCELYLAPNLRQSYVANARVHSGCCRGGGGLNATVLCACDHVWWPSW